MVKLLTRGVLFCLLQYLRELEGDRGGWVYVDLFRFVTHVIRVALTLAQFVLAFFPDKDKSSVFMMEEVSVCERRMYVGKWYSMCTVQ